MKTSQTVSKIVPAFLKAQKEMESVTKDAKNPYYNSAYADINSFLEVAVPTLNNNDIVILQPVHSSEHGHFVETTLYHASGEFIQSEPMRLELSKPDMQQLGSATTYARRYQLQALLGMRAQDDDANAAVGKISDRCSVQVSKSTTPKVITTSTTTSGPISTPATPTPPVRRNTFKKSAPTPQVTNGHIQEEELI